MSLSELGETGDDAWIVRSTTGVSEIVVYAFRNAIGSVQAARMDNKIARNVTVDSREDINGKRATTPLNYYELNLTGIYIHFT